jgi:hypothetical protein
MGRTSPYHSLPDRRIILASWTCHSPGHHMGIVSQDLFSKPCPIFLCRVSNSSGYQGQIRRQMECSITKECSLRWAFGFISSLFYAKLMATTALKELPMKTMVLAALCLCLILTCSPSAAYDLTLNKTPVQVYFSPTEVALKPS